MEQSTEEKRQDEIVEWECVLNEYFVIDGKKIDYKLFSYFLGLIYADGHFDIGPGNKSRVSIELAERDKDIIFKLNELLPIRSTVTSRTRDTNFKKNNTTYNFRICNMKFRDFLLSIGLIAGKKSYDLFVPTCSFSEIDFLRGFWDGDGSIGFKKDKFPFVGLVTKSEKMCKWVCDFIFKNIGHKIEVNRNKRDNVYNLSLVNEDAVKFSKLLYYDGCVSINRKHMSAKEILLWVRPSDSTKREFQNRKWHKEDNEFILNHSIEESCDRFGVTELSIKMKLWRLEKEDEKQLDIFEI